MWPAALKLVAGCKQANPLIWPVIIMLVLSWPQQSCQYAIYGFDLRCQMQQSLSLLRQLVASCNEACRSFASCYKAWPTVLHFNSLSEASLNR